MKHRPSTPRLLPLFLTSFLTSLLTSLLTLLLTLLLTVFLTVFSLPAVVQAQAPRELTDSVIREALDLYNRPGTIRLNGDSRVSAASEIIGDLALLDGLLEIAGRVRGNVLVLHGDLRLLAGAQIEGFVVVIGGTVTGPDSARVGQGIRVYRGGFAYQLQDGLLVRVERRAPSELSAGREFDFGRTDLVVSARRGYNRVEGLPILAGPRITLGRSNPSVVEALGIYRTGTGARLAAHDLGYALRAEQYLGGRHSLRVGMRVFSEIAPIELGGLSDRENSLASFILHRDYRDHFERQGWTVYLGFDPATLPWSAALIYSDERNASVTAREPFSVLDSDHGWRMQPLVAEGYLRSLTAESSYDSRNSASDASHGWLLRASLERGLGGSLRVYLDSATLNAPRRFWNSTLDLRRYARTGRSSQLAVRALATGSLNGAALPAQRQHVLGGEGSLPGFAMNRFDCAAQNQAVVRAGIRYQPYYGCDRAALVQLEYQTDFKFLRGLRNTAVDQLGLLQQVRFALFFDAGRAWNEAEARDGRGGGNDDFAADGGFGVRLGPVGLYWAVPLSGRGQPMNFFLRLGPRI
ncbi:MAG: BamA/TamA family outer membrane protein [Longimicrobiales bacterium]